MANPELAPRQNVYRQENIALFALNYTNRRNMSRVNLAPAEACDAAGMHIYYKLKHGEAEKRKLAVYPGNQTRMENLELELMELRGLLNEAKWGGYQNIHDFLLEERMRIAKGDAGRREVRGLMMIASALPAESVGLFYQFKPPEEDPWEDFDMVFAFELNSRDTTVKNL